MIEEQHYLRELAVHVEDDDSMNVYTMQVPTGLSTEVLVTLARGLLYDNGWSRAWHRVFVDGAVVWGQLARESATGDQTASEAKQAATRRPRSRSLDVHVTVDDLRPEMERLVNASLAESDRAQVGRVSDFAEEYRQQFAAAVPRDRTPSEFVRSVHVNVATDVLQTDYPADMLAPKLAALALDGDAGDWLTDAERRLIVFGFDLAAAGRGGG